MSDEILISDPHRTQVEFYFGPVFLTMIHGMPCITLTQTLSVLDKVKSGEQPTAHEHVVCKRIAFTMDQAKQMHRLLGSLIAENPPHAVVRKVN